MRTTEPLVSVTVNAFGIWQMLLGVKSQRVETAGKTLRDLIDTLDTVSLGKLKKETLDAKGNLDHKYKIFVNGSSCDDLNTVIANGDDVIFFSVIDGG